MSRYIVVWLWIALSACTLGPNNGSTFEGAIVGASFPYAGFTNQPGETISIQILDPVNADPSNNANWREIKSTVTATTPTWANDPNPLYFWSANVVPVDDAERQSWLWPTGGVVRTRAVRANGVALSTFDEPTAGPCVSGGFSRGTSWQTLGTRCAGITTKASGRTSGVTAIASTARTPLDLPEAEKPNWLGRKGDILPDQTLAYYRSWNAPDTLDAFKATYHFGGGDVTATFYNNGDLGLGREMHCRVNTNVTPFYTAKQIPCYVTNYSGVAPTGASLGAVFGDAQGGVDHVLDDAVHRRNGFATVAMLYTELTFPGLPAPTTEVFFVAYNSTGTRVTNAQLDSTNKHSSIPNACLSCHGITAYYNPSANRVQDRSPIAGIPAAKFLAFDPFSYLYSTQPGFTAADQAEAFHNLNEIVRQTHPAPATIDLIDGMYASGSASPNYVPSGWQDADDSQDGTTMYRGVVKPGCRMCHASSTDPTLDFLQLNDFAYYSTAIRRLVCSKTVLDVRGHDMPQAEHVSKVFWKSGARALILGFTQPSSPDWPIPGNPMKGDPFAACDP